MNKTLTPLLFCLFSIAFFPTWAQENGNKPDDADSIKISSIADVAPEFPGGNNVMTQFLRDQTQHINLRDKPEGVVILQFIITTAGEIKDIQVIKSLHPILEQAAIEAVKKMPRWIPGSYKGQIVNVRYTLPVRFGTGEEQKTKIKKKTKQ